MKTFFSFTLLLFLAFLQSVAQTDTPDPDAFIIAEKEPQPLNMDAFMQSIQIPDSVVSKVENGQVVIRVLIDSTGHYAEHRVIQSIPYVTEIIEKQLPDLKFAPAIYKGKPIAFWVNIPLNFTGYDKRKKTRKKKRKKE